MQQKWLTLVKLGLLDLMKHLQIKVGLEAYNAMLLGHASLGEVQRCKEIFEEIMSQQLRPDIISIMSIIIL